MAFQPFGYRFEVKTLSSVPDVKAAIRSRKKRWLEAKSGARGWIIGPFICLWFSAFDRYGPMLFGRISRADIGTKITGRAGSDLNGLAVFTLMLPLIPLLLYEIVSAGEYTPDQFIIVGGLILLIPLMFWFSHKDRRQAEPLVRFLRDTVTIRDRKLRANPPVLAVPETVTLNAGGELHDGPVTWDALHDALLNIGSGDFAILEAAPERYIQTAFRDGGYVVEMRDGGARRHFEATRRDAAPSTANEAASIFTFEEVREAFIAFATGAPMPPFLLWKPMQLAK